MIIIQSVVIYAILIDSMHQRYQYVFLETFMGVVQRTGAGSKPRISRVVSKSDRDHGSGYYGNRTLGPAGTICHSTRTLVPAP